MLSFRSCCKTPAFGFVLTCTLATPLCALLAQQTPGPADPQESTKAPGQNAPPTTPTVESAATPGQAPAVVPPTAAPAAQPTAPANLRFSFDRTPWRDVITWLASEANLALHVGELRPDMQPRRDRCGLGALSGLRAQCPSAMAIL